MAASVNDDNDRHGYSQPTLAQYTEDLRKLRRVAEHAQAVMKALAQYGPGIVGHLLDDDDNAGEFLRQALAAVGRPV